MELQHVCTNWNLRVERDEYLWKLFFLEKVKPMSFVGIRAKRSRTFGNVFRQDCELCNICAQRQFFKQYFVFFFSKQKVCSIQHYEKDCSEVFRNSSYLYRGTFRRQRDSKRKMTVFFFDKLTGQFSTLFLNYCLRVLKNCLTVFSKYFEYISFGVGTNGFRLLAKSFRQCCQNCIPVLNRIASRCF